MSLGDNIKKLRVSNNYTQKELADKLTVQHQTISKWENGENEPDVYTLRQLSKLFDTTIDNLVDGEEASNTNINRVNKKESSNNFDKSTILHIAFSGVLLLFQLLVIFFPYGYNGVYNLYLNLPGLAVINIVLILINLFYILYYRNITIMLYILLSICSLLILALTTNGISFEELSYGWYLQLAILLGSLSATILLFKESKFKHTISISILLNVTPVILLISIVILSYMSIGEFSYTDYFSLSHYIPVDIYTKLINLPIGVEEPITTIFYSPITSIVCLLILIVSIILIIIFKNKLLYIPLVLIPTIYVVETYRLEQSCLESQEISSAVRDVNFDITFDVVNISILLLSISILTILLNIYYSKVNKIDR